MVTIFVLLTNETWNLILFDHMRSVNDFWPAAYFIIVLILGNYLLLKLFLGILIMSFTE